MEVRLVIYMEGSFDEIEALAAIPRERLVLWFAP